MPYKYSGTPYSGVKYEPIVYRGESLTEYQERMAKAAEEASESAEALQEGASSIKDLADKFKIDISPRTAEIMKDSALAGLVGLGGIASAGLGALAASWSYNYSKRFS